jgi:hypothetical protein
MNKTKSRNDYDKVYRHTDRYKTDRRVRTHFKDIIRRGKNESKYDELLGFNVESFRSHIEQQFEPGMTWDNYGHWEIDHIIPLCNFDYQTELDCCFKKAWALENTRPLWKNENISRKKFLTPEEYKKMDFHYTGGKK